MVPEEGRADGGGGFAGTRDEGVPRSLRGTALAVGLVYALVLENLITGLSLASQTVEKARLALLGKNSSDLVLSFEGAQRIGVGAAGVDPARAVLVLVAYAAVALALSLLLLRWSDVV